MRFVNRYSQALGYPNRYTMNCAVVDEVNARLIQPLAVNFDL